MWGALQGHVMLGGTLTSQMEKHSNCQHGLTDDNNNNTKNKNKNEKNVKKAVST